MTSSIDPTALRAELKAFEREFKQKHGHAPSRDEVKAAGFAEKYKLYQQVKSQEASQKLPAAFPSSATTRPTTPPRSVPRKPTQSASIVPKSRAVKTETATSSNPFSPVKDKQKYRRTIDAQLSLTDTLPNPFATPGKPKRRPSPHQSPPNEIPPRPVTAAISTPTASRSHKPSNPVSRARKRLRGEQVSPSPIKEKRQRVHPGPVAPFPSINALTAQDSDDDTTGPLDNTTTSFVADSPVKPPPKEGGMFHLLFDDSGASSSAPPPISRVQSRVKTKSAIAGIFPSSRRARSPSLSSEDDLPASRKPTTKPAKQSNGNSKGIHVRLGNGSRIDQTGPFTAAGPSTDSVPSKAIDSRKRRLSHAEPGSQPQGGADDDVRLLPPSPPPNGSFRSKGKQKAKPRKKAKLSAEEPDDEDEDSPETGQIPLRDFTFIRPKGYDDGDDIDPVPLFRPSQGVPLPDLDDDEGAFEVDLHEDLQNTLSLDTTDTRKDDEATVRSVLHGVRVRHYDGSKGGDVWDVGELSEGVGGDEDWEGEPMPWAAGEM